MYFSSLHLVKDCEFWKLGDFQSAQRNNANSHITATMMQSAILLRIASFFLTYFNLRNESQQELNQLRYSSVKRANRRRFVRGVNMINRALKRIRDLRADAAIEMTIYISALAATRQAVNWASPCNSMNI